MDLAQSTAPQQRRTWIPKDAASHSQHCNHDQVSAQQCTASSCCCQYPPASRTTGAPGARSRLRSRCHNRSTLAVRDPIAGMQIPASQAHHASSRASTTSSFEAMSERKAAPAASHHSSIISRKLERPALRNKSRRPSTGSSKPALPTQVCEGTVHDRYTVGLQGGRTPDEDGWDVVLQPVLCGSLGLVSTSSSRLPCELDGHARNSKGSARMCCWHICGQRFGCR